VVHPIRHLTGLAAVPYKKTGRAPLAMMASLADMAGLKLAYLFGFLAPLLTYLLNSLLEDFDSTRKLPEQNTRIEHQDRHPWLNTKLKQKTDKLFTFLTNCMM
jgi:hypothetical protein